MRGLNFRKSAKVSKRGENARANNRSFDGIGADDAGAGARSVNIEGSVVQRTEIGSVRSCLNCGKEVQEDEKFCTACGARLE